MIKTKNMNGKDWIYDLDEGYLMTPEHYDLLIQDYLFTINLSYKDADEILEEVSNENEYMV